MYAHVSSHIYRDCFILSTHLQVDFGLALERMMLSQRKPFASGMSTAGGRTRVLQLSLPLEFQSSPTLRRLMQNSLDLPLYLTGPSWLLRLARAREGQFVNRVYR
jgi:hypothetical protein